MTPTGVVFIGASEWKYLQGPLNFDIMLGSNLRAWFNGRTLAFQACDEGSIPFAR